ncbi:MAG: hypothetical protein K0B10_15465 [Vicingaceae bacterium]|nr:hypothetical protein [Vicingaceae bacterium]
MKIFGLRHVGKKVPELLKIKVENKHDPENWTWKPFNPNKIKNIFTELKKEKKEINYTVITNYTPSKIKQKVVLCFAMGNLSYGIVKSFEDLNVKFYFVDLPNFIAKKGKVNFLISNKKVEKYIEIENCKLNLDDVEFILWTPPKYPFPVFDFSMMPSFKGRSSFLFKKRWQQFIITLGKFLDDKIWLPGTPLIGSQDWQNKVSEYGIALNCGFNIPTTIFTNDKDQVRKSLPRNLLIREFSTPPYSFPPIKINSGRSSFNNLENSPTTFQEYIEKKFEYRVVVLFDKIFACRIHSQDSILTKEDWRVHDDANVKWELTQLPKDVNKKMLMFKDKLNLNWCSFDLIETKSNQFYFLEANRPGAHYWLEMFVGLDITKEIALEISKKINL